MVSLWPKIKQTVILAAPSYMTQIERYYISPEHVHCTAEHLGVYHRPDQIFFSLFSASFSQVDISCTDFWYRFHWDTCSDNVRSRALALSESSSHWLRRLTTSDSRTRMATERGYGEVNSHRHFSRSSRHRYLASISENRSCFIQVVKENNQGTWNGNLKNEAVD